jgi:hypothetical protein
MRRSSTQLAGIGALLAAYGCTLDTASSGNCDGFIPVDTNFQIPADKACAIAQEGLVSRATTPNTPLSGAACNITCGSLSNCSLPDDYLKVYVAMQSTLADAGGTQSDAMPALADAGDDSQDEATPALEAGGGSDADAAATCPPIPRTTYFLLTCTTACAQ